MNEQLDTSQAPRQRPIERVRARVLNDVPFPMPSGRWSCCSGYGEHFASCEWATWERRA